MTMISLPLTGIVAGFIDSIAGGLGLITLPSLALTVGAGPSAIGTNKIAGLVSALMALLVYARGQSIDFKKNAIFTGLVVVGAMMGSFISPLFPPQAFQVLLLGTCPVILFVILNKKLWVTAPASQDQPRWTLYGYDLNLIGAALLCGLYDGAWGPGGGMFMFLALMTMARMPIRNALITSKFANACSNAMSLTIFSANGYVCWGEGALLALGVVAGAFLGASVASKNASKIIRPMLVVVVGLLMFRVMR